MNIKKHRHQLAAVRATADRYVIDLNTMWALTKIAREHTIPIDYDETRYLSVGDIHVTHFISEQFFGLCRHLVVSDNGEKPKDSDSMELIEAFGFNLKMPFYQVTVEGKFGESTSFSQKIGEVIPLQAH